MAIDQWIQLGILFTAIGFPLAAMHRQNLIRGEALMHEVKRLTTLTEQHDQRTRKVRRRLKRLEQRIFQVRPTNGAVPSDTSPTA